MKVRVAGIVDDSIVDGDGIRLTLFVQGCPRHCAGCQNPEALDPSGGHSMTTAEIAKRLDANPLLSGITFSGGEPFLQPRPLLELAREAHRRGMDVWSYSGYTLEQLHARDDADTENLLRELDVLVDGDFQIEKRDLTLKFRGSSNQRVIDMNATRKADKVVLLYTD